MNKNTTMRELRNSTGLTQEAFAKLYDIPLSTFRKWEQGESAPPAYVVRLIARTLPSSHSALKKITGSEGAVFYYDSIKKMVIDSYGNEIRIQESLEEVKEQNLPIYLEDLFTDFYDLQARFNRDCRFDKEEDIIWTRL